MIDTGAYWTQFYKERGGGDIILPSQFAVFVAGEVRQRIATVVDIGCGDGRDSLFFARHGFQVVGVDASASAIDLCLGRSADLDAEFICSDIGSPALAENVRVHTQDRPIVFYSRFFLHAIDEDMERSFLALAKALCSPDCVLAVEFRTMRDREQIKETAAHYRRFVDPLTFADLARAYGFAPSYFVEGFGYAKYKSDDAHVARMLLQRVR